MYGHDIVRLRATINNNNNNNNTNNNNNNTALLLFVIPTRGFKLIKNSTYVYEIFHNLAIKLANTWIKISNGNQNEPIFRSGFNPETKKEKN